MKGNMAVTGGDARGKGYEMSDYDDIMGELSEIKANMVTTADMPDYIQQIATATAAKVLNDNLNR